MTNNYVFANTGQSSHHLVGWQATNTGQSSHHLVGWQATNNVLGKADTDCHSINATNQRGRISTIYACFDIAVND